MSTDTQGEILEGEFTSALKARERAREIGTTAYHAFRGTTTRVIRVIYSVVILAVAGYSFVGWVKKPSPPPPPPAATAPAASTESHVLENYKDVTPWFRPRKGFRRDWETTGGTAGVCTPNGRCELDDERRYVSVDPNTPIQFESMERNGRVTIKITYTYTPN